MMTALQTHWFIINHTLLLDQTRTYRNDFKGVDSFYTFSRNHAIR